MGGPGFAGLPLLIFTSWPSVVLRSFVIHTDREKLERASALYSLSLCDIAWPILMVITARFSESFLFVAIGSGWRWKEFEVGDGEHSRAIWQWP